jgi:hypothetical protein
MRIIIKYFVPYKTWSTIYLIEEQPEGNVVFTGGFISNITFEQFKKQNMLHEIDAVETFDKYFKCSALIADAKSYMYFEVKR